MSVCVVCVDVCVHVCVYVCGCVCMCAFVSFLLPHTNHEHLPNLPSCMLT